MTTSTEARRINGAGSGFASRTGPPTDMGDAKEARLR